MIFAYTVLAACLLEAEPAPNIVLNDRPIAAWDLP